MSIGLYDEDMMKYATVPFNLELMKLATYYKERGEITSISPLFEPYKYSKFILRKDYYDDITYLQLNKYKNITYGGLAFSNNIYSPLDEEIERKIPDVSIYNKLEKYFIENNKNGEAIFKIMTKASHCRLSLDGINIWKDWQKQISNDKIISLFFHDCNLGNIVSAPEEINNFINEQPNKEKILIYTKFPIIAKNKEELLKWSDINAGNYLYELRYNGMLDKQTFLKFVKTTSNKHMFSQFTYNITGENMSEKDFLDNYIEPLFEQVIYAAGFGCKIKLIYDQDLFFDKRWNRLIDLFNLFINNKPFPKSDPFYFQRMQQDTLFKYAKFMKNYIPSFIKNYEMHRYEAREIFEFVREYKPSLFEKFYTVSLEKLLQEQEYDAR